jgi:TolB-like protein/Tfp pilus assembly protein PilF
MRDGSLVPLTPKVLDTLLVLLENNGSVVDREDLIKSLWPDTVVEEGNLAQNISILRKALGETSEDRRYIETVPKRGYRFVAEVREWKPDSRARRIRWIVAALVLLLAAAGLILYRPLRKKEVQVQRNTIQSIAVLPFLNVSSDRQNEYFSDGLTEELIHALNRIEGLRVAARTSVFEFKGKAQDVRTIGHRLNVGAVLEGSVQKEKEKLRIRVELSDAGNGFQLWSETYEREVKDVLAIQEEIAQAVVNTLRIRLRRPQKMLVKRYTENLEAYELALKAGHIGWWALTRDNWKESIRYYEQAITKDPVYARAYAGLADIYLNSIIKDFLPPRDACPKATTAARKALAMDDTLTEAHTTLAALRAYCDWDWRGAERQFRRVLELDPNNSEAYLFFAHFLGSIGRVDEALAANQRGLELSPLNIGLNLHLGWIYVHTRRYGKAVESILQTLRLNPNAGVHVYGLLSHAYAELGRYQESITVREQAGKLDPDYPVTVAGFGYTYAKWGKRAEALHAIERLKQMSKTRYVSAARPAEIYSALHQNDDAFEWLEKACDEHAVTMIHLKMSPEYDPVRSDPRFARFLKRIYGE